MIGYQGGGALYFLQFVAAMVLLYGVAFAVGLRVRAFLSGRRLETVLRGGIAGNLVAAGFGAVTPFCSCTTVPIFAGMLDSDVRLGHAMSFLIASPTLNPPALLLLLVVFGWQTTVGYVLAVFAVAVVGGLLLGGRGLAGFVFELLILDDGGERLTWRQLLTAYLRFLRAFIVVILVAAVLATALHGWTPSESTIAALGSHRLLAVPLLVGLGVLVYMDVLLLIPIAATLVQKGLPDGSVLAFTMAASGLGLPTLLLLSKLMDRRLIALYVAVVASLLVLVGYTLNALR
jgi:uncharacterized protein